MAPCGSWSRLVTLTLAPRQRGHKRSQRSTSRPSRAAARQVSIAACGSTLQRRASALGRRSRSVSLASRRWAASLSAAPYPWSARIRARIATDCRIDPAITGGPDRKASSRPASANSAESIDHSTDSGEETAPQEDSRQQPARLDRQPIADARPTASARRCMSILVTTRRNNPKRKRRSCAKFFPAIHWGTPLPS